MFRVVLLTIVIVVGCNCSPTLHHVKADPSEATFYRVCFNEPWNGHARNVHKCAYPDEVIWSMFPIQVYPTDSNTREITSKAISVWHEWLGTNRVFEITNSPEYSDVIISDEGASPWFLGMARPGRNNGRLHFQVSLYNSAGPDTCAHELGHVLGLAHDQEQPRSIMFPNDARWFPVLTETDRQALVSRYNL